MTPCSPWVEVADVLACTRYADADEDAVAWAVEAATDVLYALSGRQYPGPCTDVVRPTQGCVGRGCGCGRPLGIGLGVSPLLSVERVTVAGVDLDESDYLILNASTLVRRDGRSWPCCPNVLTEPPEFEVAFTWGQAPPPSGVGAALVLAGEIALSRCGADGCQLDRRVQHVVRQGVDIAMPGLIDAIGAGLTGIAEVDSFIGSANPHRLDRPPSVLVPGVAGVQRITG